MRCPCCRKELRPTLDDAPYCWDCGLYGPDDPAKCDDPDHPRKTLADLCARGLGWPREEREEA